MLRFRACIQAAKACINPVRKMSGQPIATQNIGSQAHPGGDPNKFLAFRMPVLKDAPEVYRSLNNSTPKKVIYMSEAIMAFMWYWMIWHIWYDWGHLVGENEYPDPSKWTDKELGIPADDAE